VHRYPSFSPEGNQVAFSWNGKNQDNTDIWVQQIGSSGAPLRLTTDSANDYNPVWSPDGRWIAFLRGESAGSELRLIPPLGGTERKLADIHVRSRGVTPPFLTWCPDSTCLVVTDSPGEGKPDALFVYSLETGERRQLTHPQPPALGDTHPAVSPDGNWLVFRHTAALFGNELHKLKLTRKLIPAGEPQRLTSGSLDGSYPTWTPDSKTILFSPMHGTLWKLAADQKSQPALLSFVGEDGIMPVVSKPLPGRPTRLVYARFFSDMRIWRVETSGPGVPASSPPALSPVSSTRHDWMPQLSADGHRVVFGSDRSGEGEIWVADLDGANALQLTSVHGPPGTGYPHWSPDGRWIVFHSDKEVFIVPSTGGKARNLTNHPALDSFPSFSRDGKWIYFNSNRTGEDRIWKMPASGGEPVPVTNFVGYAPLESPDGAWLYYTDAAFTPGGLWRIPVAGGAPAAKLVDGVILLNYAVLPGGIYYIDKPAGDKGSYYVDQPSTAMRLRYFDFATHRSTTIAPDLGNVDVPLTTTPDGRTILFPRTSFSIDDLMLVENFR
jgi:Tol biopolymer transport system component